ncbi:MAG: hypothetical protein QF535_16710, partial [Anaerolineales bacterium]|nr:hypothetical protein [Anaerolineales bacterium]
LNVDISIGADPITGTALKYFEWETENYWSDTQVARDGDWGPLIFEWTNAAEVADTSTITI